MIEMQFEVRSIALWAGIQTLFLELPRLSALQTQKPFLSPVCLAWGLTPPGPHACGELNYSQIHPMFLMSQIQQNSSSTLQTEGSSTVDGPGTLRKL